MAASPCLSLVQRWPLAAISPSPTPQADYSVSTFAYHVWLLDTPSTAVNQSIYSLLTSGHYFGKFDYANYPGTKLRLDLFACKDGIDTPQLAVAYPKNPAPAQFTMPDFSHDAAAGFSTGQAATDLPMQLVVIEEWGNGKPAVGHRLQTSSVGIVYNATTSAKSVSPRPRFARGLDS
ncbi:hypothetical protein BC835DRAFT_1441259 [Cytidiella melzeri]|nr:hypothetical protein BC835DRAFT_1441259 [Cytidiella melzeri]